MTSRNGFAILVLRSCAGTEPGLNLDFMRRCHSEWLWGKVLGGRPGLGRTQRACFSPAPASCFSTDMKQDSPEHGFPGAGSASSGSGKHCCARCGMTTILQTKRRYDGFTLLEEYQACGFCGTRIEIAKDLTAQPNVQADSTGKKSAMSAYLFGTDASSSSSGAVSGAVTALPTSQRPGQDSGSVTGTGGSTGGIGEAPKGHFCRDCRHYVKHPFLSRCGRHDCEVEPMQDCPDFSRSDDPPQKAKAPLFPTDP